MRRAAKVDDNQPEIVEGLRRAGASVEIIGRPVDLLVGYRGQTFILEVKDGSKVPSARVLTPTQVEFFKSWRGGPAEKVETLEQALRVIGVMP